MGVRHFFVRYILLIAHILISKFLIVWVPAPSIITTFLTPRERVHAQMYVRTACIDVILLLLYSVPLATRD